MGTLGDRIEGASDKVAGNVKKNVGQATGNDRLAGEGMAQEKQGQVKEGVAKVKGRVEGAVEQLKGSVKKDLNR